MPTYTSMPTPIPTPSLLVSTTTTISCTTSDFKKPPEVPQPGSGPRVKRRRINASTLEQAKYTYYEWATYKCQLECRKLELEIAKLEGTEEWVPAWQSQVWYWWHNLTHPLFRIQSFCSCDQAALRMVQSVCLSVRPSVCHIFLAMFPSLYHHEIFRSYYQLQKWRPCKRSRSEVKSQGHRPT